MKLREFFSRLLDLPTVDDGAEIAESQRQRGEVERQQKEIARRLELLGIDVDLMRRSHHDNGS